MTCGSSPFKGEVRRGMGATLASLDPIPTLTLPLKGRDLFIASVSTHYAVADQV